MDTGRSATFAGGLQLVPSAAIESSGFLGTRRGLKNIKWYEYAFLAIGILAALITDGLSIARLVDLNSLKEPDFAYGILIVVHSVFLLLVLITGIFYQRTSDIIAFFISAVLLTIYVVAHFVARQQQNIQETDVQKNIRLARLIITISFNVIFIPLAFLVIKDYRRDEFSKRLFGAFPAARRPLKIYTTFDCVARINTMLSISSLLINLYNDTDYDELDRIFLGVGIPIAILWLCLAIGMARLENRVLIILFYVISLFQLAFLAYCLTTTIKYSIDLSRKTTTTTTTTSTTMTMTPRTTTEISTSLNFVPVLHVLYVCLSANLCSHLLAMILGYWCSRNFNKGLKEKVFNTKIDLWFQKRL